MSELISGKEALIALANGEDVELQTIGDMSWYDSTQWTVGELLCFKGRFRLKPRTITINGIKVPAPFESKEDESIWVLSDMHNNGYMRSRHKDSFGYAFGAWQTEDEIKQVVEALRSVFK